MAGYVVNGYVTGYLAIGEKWLVPALLGAPGLAAVGLLVMRPPLRTPAILLGGLAIANLLAMPTAWSVGTILVKGNTGFPAARPPFLNEAAETQRRRWSLVAGRRRARRRPQTPCLSAGKSSKRGLSASRGQCPPGGTDHHRDR